MISWAEQLVNRAAASPHAERIRFVGFAANPDIFLGGLDVFVLPSRSEGMSNALLEAMACGLPSIATDVGSNARSYAATAMLVWFANPRRRICTAA